MKKNLFYSYVAGIQDSSRGQDYTKITGYFLPEFVTAILLYSLPILIDARFIAHLKSTPSYATLGLTNVLLHFIVKIAEGLSVGTIVMTGHFNGSGSFKEAGKVLVNAFWTTVFVGGMIASALFFGAASIYQWYGVPQDMVLLGIPFLRLRAVGIFFTFLYFAFIGFLRGIKNTRVPMFIFMGGCIAFLFFDYALIFGRFGFPTLGLQGSAWATVIQYGFMLLVSLCYVASNKKIGAYSINLFSHFASWKNVKELFSLSWPVMVDKGTMAGSYLWLGKCIAPMGTCCIASFSVIKDLERFGLLPAIAFAQVATLLVSNECGKGDWEGIKVTIKKIVLLSNIAVLAILFFCSLWPYKVISFFDMKGEFTDFASKAFPVISALAFFDVLQLILAGSLRGASDVKTVMWTRLIVCVGVFIPVSYFLSQLNMTNQVLKFMLIYSSLYLGNALMGIRYIGRLRGRKWIRQAMRNCTWR